jgi:hypothetical protein
MIEAGRRNMPYNRDMENSHPDGLIIPDGEFIPIDNSIDNNRHKKVIPPRVRY